MGNPVSKAACAASVSAALLAAAPAQAVMGCWNADRTAAVKVRDLQSRLMVAALRCKAMGIDVAGAYNDFVRGNRDALRTTNGLIRAQFETGYGRDADLYYDRFATGLANRYGGDATTADICADTASAAEEGAAAAGNVARLVALAERFGPPPDLPGGACTTAMAASPRPEAPAPAESFGAAMGRALSDASDPPPRADDPAAFEPRY